VSERERYPAGVPCWVDTTQPDPRAALDFYGAVFGWGFDGPAPMPGGMPGEYFVARVDGRDVAGIGSLPDRGGPARPSWNTYVRVDSAAEAVERARQAGGAVLAGPLSAPPAGRLAVLTDPAEAAICVWEAHAREGAQRVNEPRAWAMSSLHVADAAAAAAFYRSVFGWQAEPAGPLTLFRLPGYIGDEPRQPIPRDVVAVMAPAAASPAGEVPPHWNVNFQVADADAVAGQAAAAGGSVVIAPFDTPGFRSAVVADPQGAVFSISEPVP
jgi:predicted enzyme related to lactoylglutathione lyase